MPVIFHQGCYRPSAAPSRGLPFSVHSVGHYEVAPPFASEDKKVDYLHFFWCVRGSGIMEINGRRHVFKKNQVALYYPGMRHYWYPDRKIWAFFIFTLDGPLAGSLPAYFELQADIYNAGPAPVELFRTLFRTVPQPTKQAELRACSTAFMILAQAANAHLDQTNELINNTVKYMHEQYISPALNVKTLSASIGIRRAALSARFRAALGITPGNYLKRLRLQNALSLLTHTRLPISAVAARCGYADAHYFSRAIRHVTGRSPLQLRENNEAMDMNCLNRNSKVKKYYGH